jgi:hypothetical protein
MASFLLAGVLLHLDRSVVVKRLPSLFTLVQRPYRPTASLHIGCATGDSLTVGPPGCPPEMEGGAWI